MALLRNLIFKSHVKKSKSAELTQCHGLFVDKTKALGLGKSS